jgi:hypothetical protein
VVYPVWHKFGMSVSTLYSLPLTFPFYSMTNDCIRTNCAQIWTVWRRCGHFPERRLHHCYIPSSAMVRAKGNRQVTSDWFRLVACFFSSYLRAAHLYRIFNINIIYPPSMKYTEWLLAFLLKLAQSPSFSSPFSTST